MKVSVIFEDKTIVVDGVAVIAPSLLPSDANHRALQWNNDRGFIEVHQGDRVWLTDIAVVQPYIDLHSQIIAEQIAAAKAAAEAAAKAAAGTTE